ncbi:hypothetical protein MASR1M59_08500 [Melaminivora sp.]
MKKRFSTLLLTGKAATLPLLLQNAQAMTPSYTQMVTSELTQVQMPADKVQLDSLGGLTRTPGMHGGAVSDLTGAATLCHNLGVPDQMSVVITGLQNGDSVYLFTATSTGGNENLHPRMRIGNNGIQLITASAIQAPSDSRVSITVPVSLQTLRQQGYNLTQGGRFYMQTVVFPAQQTSWTGARISELDEISVGNCSTYGGTPY